jgi:hypothetical protein
MQKTIETQSPIKQTIKDGLEKNQFQKRIKNLTLVSMLNTRLIYEGEITLYKRN